MKKILLTFFVIVSSLSITPQQPSKTTTTGVSDSSVDKKIAKVAEELKQDKEFISTVMEENRKKLQQVKSLDKKEEALFKRILRNLDRRKKVPKGVKTIVRSGTSQGSSKVVVKEKLVVADSTCVEYDRNFFGVKKCIEWEVNYKEVNN